MDQKIIVTLGIDAYDSWYVIFLETADFRGQPRHVAEVNIHITNVQISRKDISSIYFGWSDSANFDWKAQKGMNADEPGSR